jgi:hypothetical protein
MGLFLLVYIKAKLWGERAETPENMSSLITSLAHTAHAHASALLASRQVQPGDKLPLSETVKENDAGKPITLAPTGRNIFVRIYSSARFPPMSLRCAYMRAALTKMSCCCRCHKGRRAWGVHTHLQLAGAGLH